MASDEKSSGDVGKREENEDFVDPWNVVSSSDTGIDYDKLISKSSNYCPEKFTFF